MQGVVPTQHLRLPLDGWESGQESQSAGELVIKEVPYGPAVWKKKVPRTVFGASWNTKTRHSMHAILRGG